ncbi:MULTISPECIES: multicopper oxidase family protein [Pandoraea]|uniref:Copper resistance system multicopper oxidase n=2 Tax=Pandoraea TaxID=93217 RepID=A0A5E5PDE2_9BURK|nr:MULTISPECIES: multicopper oxidase family protein [Pandoraea]MBN9094659.1 multicopper oxidase family protein [Pandoraea pnomenusa]RRJ28842.1 multicopper oxidase family protein [Pandoraea apista]RRJ73770.1 multicopper oxidase family protein [Pandoraea apista]RSD07628.1 multicopper oxidase family protein [Pandoraea apista]RSD12450.1 multicopper oxidase family protein [Pandoraea apista]
MSQSRRKFLLTSAAAASAVLTGCAQWPSGSTKEIANGKVNGASRRLIVDTRSIEVNGRAATVYGLHQPGGTRGLFLDPGERFAVELDNRLNEPTIVHWHGQTPPSDQDGVSQFGVPELQPGERRAYDFAARPGTYWMHSHHGFQHQKLLAAPLVVRTADDVKADRQEVTIFLEDFLFRDPAEVFSELQKGKADSMGAMTGQKSGEQPRSMGGMSGMSGMGSMNRSRMPDQMPGMKMDLNDVDFDAYLANDRTLNDPEVIRVEQGGRVRLRIINGASSTNFHIDLGALQGTVATVDGNAVRPLTGRRFGLAMAQRIDILVDVPNGTGAWPILAVREGARQQTGIILASNGANVGKIAGMATATTGPVSFDQELRLSALRPLVDRPVDSHAVLMLTGSMQPYTWGINHKGWDNRDTVKIRKGQRVAITFQNTTMMAHPMHLHGHHFQIVALNGKAFSGALRDTVHVPPMAKLTLAFDADNAGRWLMHCHNLYHMMAGMITEVGYV